MFQSLLYNLIDNGMKASGEGQTLRVFCEKSEQTLTVAVEDQGIGMSPEELKKITDPFIWRINPVPERKAEWALACLSARRSRNAITPN